jgi:predicted MPP superfamily phosphohydrolase
MPGPRIFLFLAVFIGFQIFVYLQFVRYLKTTKFYKPSLRWWAAAPFIVFNIPFILIAIIYGGHFNPPNWFRAFCLNPFYVWVGATFVIIQWLLIGKIIKLPFQIPIWLLKIFKPMREKIKRFKERKTVQKVDLSRRQFVKYATFAVSTYAFAGATYGVLKRDAYQIDYKNIKIENLPDGLKGLTITLFSDIHAGQYMNENDMREYSDVVNDLHSDLIIIPGDFVNSLSEDAKPVAAAFRDLHAKYGVYGSLGNHDYFQNPDIVADVLNNESPIQVLRNQHRKINIKGHDLYILGVEDTKSSGTAMNDVVLKYFDDLSASLNENEQTFKNSPKLLMCHKPYGFDDLAQRDIDLVLSGHTHGGQVVPFKFEQINISFAALVSKYIEGLYKIGKANMYVSRGIGCVGLPIRLNCPPEITKITLV